MHHEHFIAFDTETGGLDSTECALLSIAAVPSWDAPPFSIHILPVGRIETKAAEINGYSDAEWQRRGAVTPKVAAFEFQRWRYQLDNRRFDLAAHHAGFEVLFMLAFQQRTGVDLALPGIWHCTKLKLQALRDEGILPPGDNHLDDLGALSGFWDIAPRSTHHDALQDAQCVKHGLFWLRAQAEKRTPPVPPPLILPKPCPCGTSEAPQIKRNGIGDSYVECPTCHRRSDQRSCEHDAHAIERWNKDHLEDADYDG